MKPDARIGKSRTQEDCPTADRTHVMSYDPKAQNQKNEYETELPIAKSLDVNFEPPSDGGMARLSALKDQLLSLFIRLQRGELSGPDAKAQSLLIQEELSKAIWGLEDWQTQVATRN